MSTAVLKPATTPIPVQLSEREFTAFIFPHLSMPKRGPSANWATIASLTSSYELVASFGNPCKSLKEKDKIDGLAVCVSGADGPNTMAIRRIPGLHCATKCSAFF